MENPDQAYGAVQAVLTGAHFYNSPHYPLQTERANLQAQATALQDQVAGLEGQVEA
jgi:hypothetical protein